jgi:ferredoxin like protein
MTTKSLTLEARLGLDKYEIDAEQSHITLAIDRCATCTVRPCLSVCPAQVYTAVEGHIAVRYENCLECGTCQLACDNLGQGGITWRNPQGGFGIQFRYG